MGKPKKNLPEMFWLFLNIWFSRGTKSIYSFKNQSNDSKWNLIVCNKIGHSVNPAGTEMGPRASSA